MGRAKARKQKKTAGESAAAGPAGGGALYGSGAPAFCLIGLAALLLVTAACYWQVGEFSFLNFDDDAYVELNHHVNQGLSAESIFWAVTAFHSFNWHPLTWLSHMLDCELFGLRAGPHHRVNLLLHLAATALLFTALLRLTGAAWRSLFVAAVFALHPMHVESVAWIAERKDVLSAVFWMLVLLAYAGYVRTPTRARLTLLSGVYALGLTAKPMLVSLPLVLLLLDWWPLGRVKPAGRADADGVLQRAPRALVIEKVPLFMLSALSCLLTYRAQQSGGIVQTLDVYPLGMRLANVVVSYAAYIGKLFWPSPLAFYYPYREFVPAWQVLGSLALLGGIGAAAWSTRRQTRWFAVGMLWYLVTLVPVIGLVQVSSQSMADRYSYIPYIGLSIVFAWGLPAAVKRWPAAANLPAALGIVSVCLMTWGTARQVPHWRDSYTLSLHASRVVPGNFLAYNCLGNALDARGRTDEAIELYRSALKLKPDYVNAHSNLAVALFNRGAREEALEHFSTAARLHSRDADLQNDLGIALAATGNLAEALATYRRALALDPEHPQVHINLGNALIELGRPAEALEHFRTSLRITPDSAEAHYNMAVALEQLGRHAEAAAAYRAALHLKPDFAQARDGLRRVSGAPE